MTAQCRAVVAFAGALLFAAAVAPVPAQASSAPFTIDGSFSLKSVDGHTVTDRDFRGKWMLIYFGYTYCPDVCPTVLSQIGNALRRIDPRASRFQPIFITLDPARDSPRVLKSYLQAIDPRFIGLRGDAETTKEVADQFHVYFRLRQIGGGQYTVDHSSFVYVFDPKGRFVALLTGDMRGHALADAFVRLAR